MQVKEIVDLVKAGVHQPHSRFEVAFNAVESLAEAQKLRKAWAANRALDDRAPTGAGGVRIAVTGSGTLDYLAALIKDGVDYAGGSTAEVYVSNYGEYVSDLMDHESALWAFDPDFVVFVTDSAQLNDGVQLSDPETVVRDWVSAKVGFLSDLLAAPESSACQFMVLNAIPPLGRFPGRLRLKQPGSDWRLVQAWNQEIVDVLSDRATVVDLFYEAALVGLEKAFNGKQWFESKLPFDLDFHVNVARILVTEVLSLRSADKKVVVVDCDNTIWGGVVGDDGIDGIEIGSTSPRGEAFAHVQRHLLKLKQAGFLIGVASKNQPEVVQEVFREHPEMVLRSEDVVSFKVNWEPKADNIAEMAQELNLGLDSFVFLDDNPAEVEIVRQFLPEVSTIQASEDPVQTLADLVDSQYLYRNSITDEDTGRTELYRAEADRQNLASKASNYEDYLRSLEMRATVAPLDELTIPRASQLVNKSNQFNLTTVRRTEKEVAELAGSSGWQAFTVRLEDKFGDHGIIAVVFTETRDSALEIETFVMSCRVLKRGVEQLVANVLAELAAESSCEHVVGIYRPTKKNVLVESLYADLGFTSLSNAEDEQRYVLDLATFQPFTPEIAR